MLLFSMLLEKALTTHRSSGTLSDDGMQGVCDRTFFLLLTACSCKAWLKLLNSCSSGTDFTELDEHDVCLRTSK